MGNRHILTTRCLGAGMEGRVCTCRTEKYGTRLTTSPQISRRGHALPMPQDMCAHVTGDSNKKPHNKQQRQHQKHTNITTGDASIVGKQPQENNGQPRLAE